jgi:hypothetical protein
LFIISCFHLFRTWKYWHLWNAKPHAKFSIHKIYFHGKALSLSFDQIFHNKTHNIIRNEMQLANQCQLCNFHSIMCSKIDRLVSEHLNSQRACIHFPINFNHRDPKGLCSFSLDAPSPFYKPPFGFEMSKIKCPKLFVWWGRGIVQLLVNTYLSMCN